MYELLKNSIMLKPANQIFKFENKDDHGVDHCHRTMGTKGTLSFLLANHRHKLIKATLRLYFCNPNHVHLKGAYT